MQEHNLSQEHAETSDRSPVTANKIGKIAAAEADYIIVKHVGEKGVPGFTFVELSNEDGSRNPTDAPTSTPETN